MGLRTHDVGSESVARMSRSQAAAGLSSIPPSSLPLKDGLLFGGGRLGDLALASSPSLPFSRGTHLVVFTTSPDVLRVPAVIYLLTQQ